MGSKGVMSLVSRWCGSRVWLVVWVVESADLGISKKLTHIKLVDVFS